MGIGSLIENVSDITSNKGYLDLVGNNLFGRFYTGFDDAGSSSSTDGTMDYLLSCNGNTSNSSISLYKPTGFSSPDTATNPVNLG